MVIPVADKANDYANYVVRQLMLYGFYAEADTSGNTLQKKVRNAQMAQWNYMAVVGEKEANDLSVNVRERGNEKPLGTFTLPELVNKLLSESAPSSQPLNQFEAYEGRRPEGAAAGTAPAAPAAPVASAAPAAAKAKAKAQVKVASAPKAAAASPGRPSPLQMRKQGSKQFAELSVDDDVEHFLETHSYVKGSTPSKADLELYNQTCESHLPETPNLLRWFHHIQSFSAIERESWA